MPPGASNLGDNRFALLSPSSKPKRKKVESTPLEPYPELPVLKKDDPKFVLINSVDVNKPLSSLSCFAVHKGIQAISKEVNSISDLRDGSILLLVKNKKVAEKFLSAKSLPGVCEIKANLHGNLNCVKGTIFAPFLSHVSEEDIVDGLKQHGVTSVYKFTKSTNGVSKTTGSILLTFDRYQLPEKIEVAWRILSVRPYIPSPMRCKSCQKLGHTTKYCKSFPLCPICSLPPHSPTECTRVICANCAGEHPSFDNSCPKFLQSKEILKIKTLEKCSMREAVKKYKNQFPATPNPSSFANVVKSPLASNSVKSPATIIHSSEPISPINSSTSILSKFQTPANIHTNNEPNSPINSNTTTHSKFQQSANIHSATTINTNSDKPTTFSVSLNTEQIHNQLRINTKPKINTTTAISANADKSLTLNNSIPSLSDSHAVSKIFPLTSSPISSHLPIPSSCLSLNSESVELSDDDLTTLPTPSQT